MYLPKEWRYAHHHSKDLIIGDPSIGIKIRASFKKNHDYLTFISQIKFKTIEEAKSDPN